MSSMKWLQSSSTKTVMITRNGGGQETKQGRNKEERRQLQQCKRDDQILNKRLFRDNGNQKIERR